MPMLCAHCRPKLRRRPRKRDVLRKLLRNALRALNGWPRCTVPHPLTHGCLLPLLLVQ